MNLRTPCPFQTIPNIHLNARSKFSFVPSVYIRWFSVPSRSFRKNVGRKSNGLRGKTRCFSSSVYIRARVSHDKLTSVIFDVKPRALRRFVRPIASVLRSTKPVWPRVTLERLSPLETSGCRYRGKNCGLRPYLPRE